MDRKVFLGVVLGSCIAVFSGCASYRCTVLNQAGVSPAIPARMSELKPLIVAVEGDSYRKEELIQALRTARVFKEIGESLSLSGRPDLILTIKEDSSVSDLISDVARTVETMEGAMNRGVGIPYVIPTKSTMRDHFRFTLTTLAKERHADFLIKYKVTEVHGWLAPLLNILGGSTSRANSLGRSFRTVLRSHSGEIKSLLR